MVPIIKVTLGENTAILRPPGHLDKQHKVCNLITMVVLLLHRWLVNTTSGKAPSWAPTVTAST